jgi:DNA-binding protein HU-beta
VALISASGCDAANNVSFILRSSALSGCQDGETNNFEETTVNSFSLRGAPVNKTELIEHIAKHADISKAAATRALESMIGAVKTTLKKGGSVSLVGFGTFAVGKRAARSGRNPRTGAQIKIKAAKVPKFRPGKALKDALN